MSKSMHEAVVAASEQWKNAFNSGDARACANCYEKNAIMVAKPFGTFEGRESIEGFWRDLIAKGFADVRYTDPKITPSDAESAVLESGWTMNNAHGVITHELWVRQADGSVLLREDHFEALA